MASAVFCQFSGTSRAITTSSTINGSQAYRSMPAMPLKKSRNNHTSPKITEPMASKTDRRGVWIVCTVRLASARMREDDKNDRIVNRFSYSQKQDHCNRTGKFGESMPAQAGQQ